jgi:hypothetical protein
MRDETSIIDDHYNRMDKVTPNTIDELYNTGDEKNFESKDNTTSPSMSIAENGRGLHSG